MALPAGGETLLFGWLASTAAVTGRFAWSGLIARYPMVCAAVLFSAARLLSFLYVWLTGARPFGRDGYGLVYVTTQPVLWALYFLVVVELYSLTLDEFPGIRRLGKLVLVSGVVAIALAAAGLMILDQQAGVDPYPFLGYLALQERSVFTALSAVTVLLLLFIAHYRLPVRRNVLILWACFGGYFLCSAVLMTLRFHFGAEFAGIRNVSNAFFYYLALAGATLFLSRAGETQARPMRPLWGGRNRDLEMSLSLQLQGLNRTLSKVLKQ
jgi:hypothetical protein